MLTDLVQTYLRTRRAMGFDLDESGRLLGQYAEFAVARGESHVRADTAVEWAAAAATAGGRFHRLLSVRVFARYVRGEDPRHEVPSQKVFPRPPRQRLPTIYTPDEARRLVAAAGRLTPIGSLRAHAFSTLVALLFATGLRISEALALRFDDITKAGLVVRQTKFRKTRLVPLHETAQAGLDRYLVRRRRAVAHDDHVFINFRGEPLGHRGANAMFREALRAGGIERPRGQPRPRIHDIRHYPDCRIIPTLRLGAPSGARPSAPVLKGLLADAG